MSDSYAGGHVITIKDSDDNETGVDYDRTDCNVQGSNAGGLIGSSTGNLTVENCYATGYVKDSENAGAFVGTSGTATYDKNNENGYFSLVNDGLSPVANQASVEGISSWDEAFNAYGRGKAEPYHELLKEYYTGGDDNSLYTFLTINELCKLNNNNQLNSNEPPEWMTTHYGDWPPLDTLVTVTGTFDIYEENGYKYITLINADMKI